jgi:hypothetical protein
VRLLNRIPVYLSTKAQKMLDYLTDASARRATYGISIPLLSFPRGDYSGAFEVRDSVQAKSVSKSTTFSIY